jgi:hypothetical protein
MAKDLDPGPSVRSFAACTRLFNEARAMPQIPPEFYREAAEVVAEIAEGCKSPTKPV